MSRSQSGTPYTPPLSVNPQRGDDDGASNVSDAEARAGPRAAVESRRRDIIVSFFMVFGLMCTSSIDC
jgi:hypothetical protein